MELKPLRSVIGQERRLSGSAKKGETTVEAAAVRENSDNSQDAVTDSSTEETEHTPPEEDDAEFRKLGWIRMTVCLIVEAIAIGSFSIPSAFATLGMGLGLCLTIGFGLLSVYISRIIGSVSVKFRKVKNYADAVDLILGRIGYEVASVMFVLVLILINGSHVLTGTMAFSVLIDRPGICALSWGGIAAFLLFVFALPPSFHKFSILGYIDLVSIVAAISVIMIAAGIGSYSSDAPPPTWTWAPAEGVTFKEAFLSATNIIFAYSFSMCQFSFMAEMHTPEDFMKSIWTLGIVEIFFYTVMGATIYAFIGVKTPSPVLLSGSYTISRIAFGLALPVIFISGSINTTVLGHYVLNRYFVNRPGIRLINTRLGVTVWICLIFGTTVIGWAIAEAVPFFNALLGLISSLFISGFCFYFPALFYLKLLQEDRWYSSWRNIGLALVNVMILCMGLVLLGCGTYASVLDILDKRNSNHMKGSFTCSSAAYGV